MIPIDPSWIELASGALAGALGLRGTQAIRNRNGNGGTTLRDVVVAIRDENTRTRGVLNKIETNIAIVLDRTGAVRNPPA